VIRDYRSLFVDVMGHHRRLLRRGVCPIDLLSQTAGGIAGVYGEVNSGDLE
jgi:hypothetical protein